MVSIEIIGNPTVASGCLFLFSSISLSEFLQAYLQCDGPQHGRTQPWTLEGTIKSSRNLQRHHGAHDAYLILFSDIRLERSCIHRIRLFCFKARVVDLRRRSRETRPVQPEMSPWIVIGGFICWKSSRSSRYCHSIPRSCMGGAVLIALGESERSRKGIERSCDLFSFTKRIHWTLNNALLRILKRWV